MCYLDWAGGRKSYFNCGCTLSMFWSPRLNKKEKVVCVLTFTDLCFLADDAMWPVGFLLMLSCFPCLDAVILRNCKSWIAFASHLHPRLHPLPVSSFLPASFFLPVFLLLYFHPFPIPSPFMFSNIYQMLGI